MKIRLTLTLFISLFILTSCDPDSCDNIVYNNDDKITFLDDKPYTGRCGIYSENGERISIQQYINGKDHNKWIFYHENGKVKTKGRFNMGNREGKWSYYHENGKVQQISHYKNGVRVKEWSGYDIEGNLIWTELYDNGVIIN
jgi:antitoxin component YwqK of YwqJK toxin-antitoxin module